MSSMMCGMLLGAGVNAKKTYADDIFSTFLYKGNGSARSINNGIDLSGKGGLVWTKTRNHDYQHFLIDTVRGNTKGLASNTTAAEATKVSNDGITSFNSNGYSLGVDSANPDGYANENNKTYASWAFRKSPGFFDVVTYTGNSSDTQTISHSLGCVHGLIIVKRTNDTGDFAVLHRNLGAGKYLRLNQTSAESDTDQIWNDTEPTSTQFTAGVWVNAENSEYVAYLFAGGESTAATARSVDFDGSDDHLSVPNSNDYSFGSGDFTVEGWFNLDTTSSASSIIGVWDYSNTQRSWLINADNNGQLGLLVSPNGSGGGSTTSVVGGSLSVGQWTHFAGVRNGNTLTLYVNGEQVATSSFSGSLYDNSDDSLFIGSLNGTANRTDGKISNIRVVKGTAVYTSNFTPPSAALTNITNTKLLCCQSDSSTTTAAVIATGSITAAGDPTASSQTISWLSSSLGTELTWPTGITWNGGSAPTLAGASGYSLTGQVFNLVTSDGGSTWYGYEEVNNSLSTYQAWVWGRNEASAYGQLGLNDKIHYSSPVQVPGLWQHMEVTSQGSAGIKAKNELWTWGKNEHGQLGQNSQTSYSSPVQVPGTNWTNVSVINGYDGYMIATKSDGTLWGWGGNKFGNLGQNQAEAQLEAVSSPVQVGSGTDWTTSGRHKITATFGVSAAIKTDGTLWSWGYGYAGVQGVNDQVKRSSPVQIPGTTWKYVVGSTYTMRALKTDGTMWSWGYNDWGQLGLNDTVGRSSPTQVGSGSDWNDIFAGSNCGAATKTDGTLWTWGTNCFGNTGTNTSPPAGRVSSPVQVPGTTWSELSTGGHGSSTMLCTKTDGSLWAWGSNWFGNLGQNSRIDRSSPVQVGSATDWNSVILSNSAGIAALK